MVPYYKKVNDAVGNSYLRNVCAGRLSLCCNSHLW